MTTRSNGEGFGLAEYLLALALMSVVVLSLLGVFASGNSVIQKTSDMALADELGCSLLEALKREVKINGSDALPPTPFRFDGRQGDDVVSLLGATFPPSPYPLEKLGNQTYTLLVEGTDEGSKLKKIKVTVFWNDNKKIVLGTLVYPRS